MNTQLDFFNTINESGDTLKELKTRFKGQQGIILKFFEANRGKEFTPFQVLAHCELSDKTPITSIRRSITNLTEAGYLKKTDKKAMGAYGIVNYKWTLK